MKKILLISITIIFIMPAFSQEKPATERKNEFRVDFFYLIGNTLLMEYERDLGSKSVVIAGGLTMSQTNNSENIGGQIEGQLRFYARPDEVNAYRGIYLGPMVRYRNLRMTKYYTTYDYSGNVVESNRYEDLYSSVIVGFLSGIKLAPGNKVVFDWNIGGGLRYSAKSTSNPAVTDPLKYFDIEGVYSPGYTGILPLANFSFGMTF